MVLYKRASLKMLAEDTMKKNKLISFLVICMLSTMLVGCNKEEETVVEVETEEENMFGLTESEQKMYAEYAAGVLMKYNAGSNMRVLEGQTLINQEAKEKAAKEQAEKRAQLAAEYEANKNSSKSESQSSGSGSSGSSEGTSVSYITDMSAATGTNAFSITYEGYEITDSYPNSGDDILMAMDATQGKLLLVTKYSVTNISGQTENFDMFSKQAKFRLNLNGERYKSQYTLLLDDLSMYKGDIDAGATINTVLIFEIPEDTAANISDMVLSITVDDAVSSMQLAGGNAMWTTTNVEESDIDVDSMDSELENTDENQEGRTSEQDSSEESQQNEEYNDLAEEYLEAIEAENAGLIYGESEVESNEGGNVTVVGSNSN